MKTLIAASTLSVIMAAGGAFAQSTYGTGTTGSAGGDSERMTMPAPVMDDSSTSVVVGLDTTTTGSINTNSNCTPPNGGNPINMPAEQQAPIVQSCNPR